MGAGETTSLYRVLGENNLPVSHAQELVVSRKDWLQYLEECIANAGSFAMVLIKLVNIDIIAKENGYYKSELVAADVCNAVSLKLSSIVGSPFKVACYDSGTIAIVIDGVLGAEDRCLLNKSFNNIFHLPRCDCFGKPILIDLNSIFVSYQGENLTPYEFINSAQQLLSQKGVSVIVVGGLEQQEIFDFNYVELLDAINQGQLELWFQPKVKLSSRQVVGYEALLRWHHPKHGLIAPGVFLQSFNDYRLDHRLNEWVINSAFSRCAELSKAGISKTVAINLEAHLLEDELTIKTIKAALDKLSVEPSLIEFEIIETMVIPNNSVKHKALLELKQMGFSVAIDDFGTGTNNISYLMYLPVDTVKLDMMFCTNVNSIKGFVITRSAIAMAKSCGYTVVAEGIETEAQANMMYSLGCQLGQGFYFGKPEPQSL